MIGPGRTTRAEAAAFCARWPVQLAERLRWFGPELEVQGPELSELDQVVRAVVDRLGLERPVEPVPEWYDESLRDVGWTAYGAALAEGLIAHVSAIYERHLGAPLRWVLDGDPKSAFHLRPVVGVAGVPPPWRQVVGVLREVQEGGDPAVLREAVQLTLRTSAGVAVSAAPSAAPPFPGAAEAPLVVVADLGRRRWQVSFPEDVDALLGSSYADLEDVLGAVDAVEEAKMEDRDRALVTTRRRVGRAELEAGLTAAVAAMVDAQRDRR